MRPMHLAVLTLLAIPCLAASPPPTAMPATQPATTKPATTKPVAKPQRVTLLNGAVRMYLPADWTLISIADDQLSLQYKMSDEKSVFAVLVIPQQTSLSNRAAQVIKTGVIDGLKKNFKEAHTEVLMDPHSEPDDRFFVTVHDRVKEEGHVIDELHLYRMVGLELVAITVVAKADSPQDAKLIHTAGQDAALSIGVGPPDKKPVNGPRK